MSSFSATRLQVSDDGVHGEYRWREPARKVEGVWTSHRAKVAEPEDPGLDVRR
jgi:hypothetical protein